MPSRTKLAWGWSAAAAPAIALAAGLSACGGHGDSSAFPPVALTYVGGAKVFMSPAEVRRALAITAPVVVGRSGSSSTGTLAICDDKIHGSAYFLGYAPTVLSLRAMRFFAGATTDRGVGIGSTRSALQRAYGRDLHVDPEGVRPAVYIVGPQGHAGVSGGEYRLVTYFELASDSPSAKVVRLDWGHRQSLVGTRLLDFEFGPGVDSC